MEDSDNPARLLFGFFAFVAAMLGIGAFTEQMIKSPPILELLLNFIEARIHETVACVAIIGNWLGDEGSTCVAYICMTVAFVNVANRLLHPDHPIWFWCKHRQSPATVNARDQVSILLSYMYMKRVKQ